jgi:hypothetical protein
VEQVILSGRWDPKSAELRRDVAGISTRAYYCWVYKASKYRDLTHNLKHYDHAKILMYPDIDLLYGRPAMTSTY